MLLPIPRYQPGGTSSLQMARPFSTDSCEPVSKPALAMPVGMCTRAAMKKALYKKRRDPHKLAGADVLAARNAPMITEPTQNDQQQVACI